MEPGTEYFAGMRDKFAAFATGETGNPGSASATSDKSNDGSAQRGPWQPQNGGPQGHAKSAFNAQIMKHGTALSKMDPQQRSIAREGLEPFFRAKTGTGDVTSLLQTTISERSSYIRNADVPFLRAVQLNPPIEIKDWTARCRERRQSGMASSINLEQIPLTKAYKAPARTETYAQLMFWGDPVMVTIVADAMVRNQTGEDILQEDIDAELLAIDKAKDYNFLNGIEQRSFAPYNTPNCAGVLSKLYTNVASAGGANVTDAEIQALLNQVRVVVGKSAYYMIFTDSLQTATFRSIELLRYNGNNPMSFYNYNSVLADRFKQFGVSFDRTYDGAYGPPVPVSYEQYLPTGTSYYMPLDPQLAPREMKFKIGNQYGPWNFVRVQYEMIDSVLVADGGSIDRGPEDCQAELVSSL